VSPAAGVYVRAYQIQRRDITSPLDLNLLQQKLKFPFEKQIFPFPRAYSPTDGSPLPEMHIPT
jgi:hypothetical protein